MRPLRHCSQVLSAFVIFGLLQGCRRAEEPAAEEAHPAPVEAVKGETKKFGEWTELIGTTVPLPGKLARITAPVEGRVFEMLAGGLAEGQVVQAGQIIAKLDDRLIKAQRDKLAATARELEQQKVQAELAVQLARIDVDRYTKLRPEASANGSTKDPILVSPVELEKAQVALNDALSKQKGVADKQAAADVELHGLDVQLALYSLRAPISGRLGLIQIVPGQTLASGTTVAEIIDLVEIDALCFAPPAVSARLRLDQPVRIVNDKGDAFAGKVVYIAAQAQADTGNFAVKARFANQKYLLRANAVVHVQVQTEPEAERFCIPDSALLEDEDPPAVVVVEKVEIKKDKDGKEEHLGQARKLKAHIGVRDRHEHVVEIVSLEDPEKKRAIDLKDVMFITKGGHGLHDDDPVKIEEEEHGKDEHDKKEEKK